MRAARLVVASVLLVAVVVAGRALYREHLARKLYQAVRASDLNAVRDLLRKGAPPDCSRPGQALPISFALGRGDTEIALALIEASPSVVAGTFLCDAIAAANLKIAKDLLRRGADPNGKCPYSSFTPLMEAAQIDGKEMTTALLEAGANVNDRRNTPGRFNGETALTRSLYSRNYKAAEVLLQQGADPNVRFGTLGDDSTLMIVCRSGDPDAVRMLLEAGADPNLRDTHGWGPYQIALARYQKALQGTTPQSEGHRSAKEERQRFAAILRLLTSAGVRDLRPMPKEPPPPKTWQEYLRYKPPTLD